jgi:Asp-tRNA(Asn)/Glu-tRNA(Gln) amidotransferase A subunit family amidase
MAGWAIETEGDLRYGLQDANLSLRNMEYVWLANFAGCPALSCPVGYVKPKKGSGDIPIGFMGMSDWGSEDLLIEWGRDVERWLHEGCPGGRRRPAGWEDVLGNARRSVTNAS